MTQEQLTVVPVPSNKKEGRTVAYIGKQLCFFEADVVTPTVDVPIEVMVTRALYRKTVSNRIDTSQLMALMLRPVTSRYAKVPHSGFAVPYEGAGLIAQAMYDGRPISLFPGATQARQHTPGFVFIQKAAVPNGTVRVAGLADWQDGEYAPLVNLDGNRNANASSAKAKLEALFAQTEGV